MKICLFGKNLTNLILSQILIKKGISVHMYHQKKNKLAKITRHNLSVHKKPRKAQHTFGS